jgi:hypothetical protein
MPVIMRWFINMIPGAGEKEEEEEDVLRKR